MVYIFFNTELHGLFIKVHHFSPRLSGRWEIEKSKWDMFYGTHFRISELLFNTGFYTLCKKLITQSMKFDASYISFLIWTALHEGEIVHWKKRDGVLKLLTLSNLETKYCIVQNWMNQIYVKRIIWAVKTGEIWSPFTLSSILSPG